MDTHTIGKWFWVVGFALAVLAGLLAAVNVTFLSDLAIAGSLILALAFIGGILYLADGDRSAFFLAALALWGLAALGGPAAGDLFVPVIGDIVQGVLTGAAAGAAAGAAGVLIMVIWEWIMPAPAKPARKRR